MRSVLLGFTLGALLVVLLHGCGGPDVTVPCIPPSATAQLDVETCVDHQDTAICRWADPDITVPEHVAGCVGPAGVICVEACAPNHYGEQP